jgi:hypothetical protein
MKTNSTLLPFSKNSLLASLCAAALLALAIPNDARAGAFTFGDLVVVQVGDGSAALAGNATAAFLQEYSISGSLIQTLNLPTAASGLNQPLTLQGTATSEGFLAMSVNGQYLTLGGYAATPGTAAPASATPATINRVVGRISLNGTIDTTTALNDAYNGSNIRSALTTDGINIWTSGNGGSGLGASAGVRYTTFGATATTQVNTNTTNMRVVNSFNGQLYVSSSTGTLLGVSAVGTGMPTTSGGAPTPLLGMPTTGTHSSYDFWFKNANTLYVADDGSAANGGGVQKGTVGGGTWTLAYTLLNNGTTTTSVRGLAGTVDGSGNAVLFGTTGSALITVTDTGASATANTLATAPANTAFRGVEYLVPEPSSAGLLLLGLLVLARARRA